MMSMVATPLKINVQVPKASAQKRTVVSMASKNGSKSGTRKINAKKGAQQSFGDCRFPALESLLLVHVELHSELNTFERGGAMSATEREARL